MRRVFLAGEGKTELGEWARERAYRELPGERGVLEALLRRVGGADLAIVDGIAWSRLVKYRAGDHASPEARNVLGAVLKAYERGCDVIAFCRDRDGDPDRENDLDDGVRRALDLFPAVTVLKGVAVENIEGWILVLLGVKDGEGIPSKRTKGELATLFGITTLQQKVVTVEAAELDGLREGSLGGFLERASRVLARVDEAPSA